LRQWIRDNPWRLTAILLGVALVAAVVVLFLNLEPDGEEVATATTTTVAEAGPGSTVTIPNDGSTLPLDPDAPAEGLGTAYVSVKIDNAPAARPQVGLAGIPLLVEYPVEGGITRFVAVVNRDVTGEMGPVRSLRPVDADLLPQLAPYVVATGGQPFVLQDVTATGLNIIDPQLLELFVFGDRDDPLNNLFLLLDELFVTVGDTPPLGDGLPAGTFPGGAPATEITLPFESTSYHFENDEYVRYDGDTQYEVLDAIGGSGGPLAHDTVVVLYVAERPAGYVDSNDVPVSTFDVIGLGDLLVFSGGEVVEGTWVRGAQEDGYRFFDSEGNSFGLPAGRVYMALVPRGAEVGY
jgi:Protein of unknown function (DUF3048) N-terminal domain/Protein of unknown function (DUF3048) C-terminal domain